MELSGVQQLGVWQANAGNATLSAYVVAEHRLVCCCVLEVSTNCTVVLCI